MGFVVWKRREELSNGGGKVENEDSEHGFSHLWILNFIVVIWTNLGFYPCNMYEF
jgi:hypothetical protein